MPPMAPFKSTTALLALSALATAVNRNPDMDYEYDNRYIAADNGCYGSGHLFSDLHGNDVEDFNFNEVFGDIYTTCQKAAADTYNNAVSWHPWGVDPDGPNGPAT